MSVVKSILANTATKLLLGAIPTKGFIALDAELLYLFLWKCEPTHYRNPLIVYIIIHGLFGDVKHNFRGGPRRPRLIRVTHDVRSRYQDTRVR